MGTRTQVKVVEEGMGNESEAMTLYHHWDGYPRNMLRLFVDAFRIPMKKDAEYRERLGVAPSDDKTAWELGRGGKVVSYLCAADPGGFEPEKTNDLHWDIEWYYIIHCINKEGGHTRDPVEWKIEVFYLTYQPGDFDGKRKVEDRLLKVREVMFPSELDQTELICKEIDELLKEEE